MMLTVLVVVTTDSPPWCRSDHRQWQRTHYTVVGPPTTRWRGGRSWLDGKVRPVYITLYGKNLQKKTY